MLTGTNSAQVETVLSTPRTELTELQSRKTSLALSSSFESQAAVQIKEWNYLDPWEFPRSVLNPSPPQTPFLSFPVLPSPLNSSFPPTPPSPQLLLASIFPVSQLLLSFNSSLPSAPYFPPWILPINSSFLQLLPPISSYWPQFFLPINSSFLQLLPPSAPSGLNFALPGYSSLS